MLGASLILLIALSLLAAGALLLAVVTADRWLPACLGALDGFLTRNRVGTWWASAITRAEDFFAGRRRRKGAPCDPPGP